MSTPIANPEGAYGFNMETIDFTAAVRGTSTANVGDIVSIALLDGATLIDVPDYTASGTYQSVFSNVTKNYTSTCPSSQMFAVCLSKCDGNTSTAPKTLMRGRFRLRGPAVASVASPTNTAQGIGARLTVMHTSTTLAGCTIGTLNTDGSGTTSTTQTRILGLLLETTSATSVPALKKVLFDGLNGFGSLNNL